MTDYARQIEQIKAAQSLDEIHAIARSFSAQATGEGGILYTGKVGTVDAMVIAQELARKTGLPIINDMPRAQFLSNEHVENAIRNTAKRILVEQGMPLEQAGRSGTDFLYGNGKIPPGNPTSVKNSLWGEASAEFAGSLRGPVVVVSSAANAERVLAQAEVPAALRANQVTTLGDHSLTSLQELHAQGGIQAVLPKVQASFIDASSKGLFVDPSMVGKQVTQVAISREVATTLLLDGSRFAGAAALSEAGFVSAPLASTAPAPILAPRVANPSFAPEGTAFRNGLSPGVSRGVAGVAAMGLAYDAYTTTEQYQALSAQGNQFGADALLRRSEGRTAGGFIGTFSAGAAYGLAAGAETGPGAFVTGAVGGVVGAFAGDKIATMVNEHKVNHQTGTDGVTYAYDEGRWSRTQHHVQLSDVGAANPYNAPNYTSTTTAAPAEQLSQLDYQRTTAVTALALANPATQDTRHIDLDGTQWHATREGWARQVEIPGVPNTYGIPAVITVDKPADARTSEQLNQIAANRQFNNDHYAADVSNAYVMDYYGKGWGANGPLPDVVTKALDLPSEQHLKDPVTGHVWSVAPEGHFTREQAIPVDKMVIREMVQAGGEEQTRLGSLQQSAMQSNAAYGQQLIAEKYEELAVARQAASTNHAITPASDRAVAVPASLGKTSPSSSVSAENELPSKAGATIAPNSSNREMFDALMTAAQNLDIDAMREVSQNYLQSDRGQAWLEQGHQLNQQQMMTQQQAAQNAQQQAQAQSGPVMQR